MLLRRLNTRLHRKDIQYILTSATLGGENDNDAVAAFAENLCNSRFTAGDVIRARRVKLTPPAVSKEPPAFFYKEVAAMIEGDKDPADILARIHDFDPNLPDDEMEALYQVIYRDPFYWQLRRVLQAPKTLRDLVREMGIAEDELTAFVTVATRAVHDGGKLFDARYHLFLRAADSVYLTLAPCKRLFLEARKVYYENGQEYKVFEAATCNNCHSIFLLGRESAEYFHFCGKLQPVLSEFETEPAMLFQLQVNPQFRDADHDGLIGLRGCMDVFIGLFTGNWSQLWDGVKEIFSGVWEAITGLFDTALNLLKSLAEVILGWFGTTWESVWTGIRSFFETIWNRIVAFFTGIWNSIVSTVTAQINAVKTVVTTVFTAISTYQRRPPKRKRCHPV